MTNLEFIKKKRAADNGGYDRKIWNEDGSVYAEVLSWEETNPCADFRTCNNGGGYFNPQIWLLVGKNVWCIEDTSCGDFGSRLFVARAPADTPADDEIFRWERCAYYGTMLSEDEEYTEFGEQDEADFDTICLLLNGEYTLSGARA